jgi:hypothetical protein
MRSKEDEVGEILKAFGGFRKKPLLALNIAHIEPASARLVSAALEGRSFEHLDVVIHTPGGHIEPAYKIVKLLRGHTKKVNIIVPSFAKSAGTLISLCGDTLTLLATSELGPLDVQIPEHQEGDVDTYKSALNGYKALEQIQKHAVENMDVATQLILARTSGRMKVHDAIKLAIEFSGNTSRALYGQIHPKSIPEYARLLEIGERYGIKILTDYMKWNVEEAGKLVRRLVYEYPSHEFIIDDDELEKLGLEVERPQGEEAALIGKLAIALENQEASKQRIGMVEFQPGPSVMTSGQTPKKTTNETRISASR